LRTINSCQYASICCMEDTSFMSLPSSVPDVADPSCQICQMLPDLSQRFAQQSREHLAGTELNALPDECGHLLTLVRNYLVDEVFADEAEILQKLSQLRQQAGKLRKVADDKFQAEPDSFEKPDSFGLVLFNLLMHAYTVEIQALAALEGKMGMTEGTTCDAATSILECLAPLAGELLWRTCVAPGDADALLPLRTALVEQIVTLMDVTSADWLQALVMTPDSAECRCHLVIERQTDIDEPAYRWFQAALATEEGSADWWVHFALGIPAWIGGDAAYALATWKNIDGAVSMAKQLAPDAFPIVQFPSASGVLATLQDAVNTAIDGGIQHITLLSDVDVDTLVVNAAKVCIESPPLSRKLRLALRSKVTISGGGELTLQRVELVHVNDPDELRNHIELKGQKEVGCSLSLIDSKFLGKILASGHYHRISLTQGSSIVSRSYGISALGLFIRVSLAGGSWVSSLGHAGIKARGAGTVVSLCSSGGVAKTTVVCELGARLEETIETYRPTSASSARSCSSRHSRNSKSSRRSSDRRRNKQSLSQTCVVS